ncbi:type II toxin-antitoxin system RelE family toxin [Aurantimicrobium minutum]|uniref:type II toxin-antitoxin system RelE family toxin n=1 Tax=Aurantimicrobium minutum TaxID=708131 RepID=UPI002475C0F7|nr:type II toxin-antitoxin system RelE/ParE family toxin [Aurantimicrobium minutum]MDH6207136.1 mRNA interferase RelE/StbE [Aurantimicrobium minutum]
MKQTYSVKILPAARVAIEIQLPQKVAAAVVEFIYGPLAENPHRIGKLLRGDLAGMMVARRGEYRVIYEIFENEIMIEIVLVSHRRTAYRRRG